MSKNRNVIESCVHKLICFRNDSIAVVPGKVYEKAYENGGLQLLHYIRLKEEKRIQK